MLPTTLQSFLLLSVQLTICHILVEIVTFEHQHDTVLGYAMRFWSKHSCRQSVNTPDISLPKRLASVLLVSLDMDCCRTRIPMPCQSTSAS